MSISPRTLLSAAVSMLFAACVVVPAQRLASDDPAARIIQTEHEIAAAIVARDIAALDHMHAADFTYIEGTGRVLNKAETLRSYDSTRFRQLTYDDLNVRVYGDTAVVTGRGRAVIERDGSAVEILARISRVHVRRGNKWEVVLYQVTRMAPD